MGNNCGKNRENNFDKKLINHLDEDDIYYQNLIGLKTFSGFKICVIGDTGVGKSSFLNYCFNKNFESGNSTKSITNWDMSNCVHSTKDNGFKIYDCKGFERDKKLDDLSYLLKLKILSTKINGIIYVLKAGRLDNITLLKYFLTFIKLSENKMKVLFLITGCEEEINNNENWLDSNEDIKNMLLEYNTIEIACRLLDLKNVNVSIKMKERKENIIEWINNISVQYIQLQGISEEILKMKDKYLKESLDINIINQDKKFVEVFLEFLPIVNIYSIVQRNKRKEEFLNKYKDIKELKDLIDYINDIFEETEINIAFFKIDNFILKLNRFIKLDKKIDLNIVF